MRYFLYFFALILGACSQSRNFEKAPNTTDNTEVTAGAENAARIQFIYDFRVVQSGFSFRAFLKSESDNYGSSIDILVNPKTGRVTLGRISLGELSCDTKDQKEVCQISWNSSVPFYGLQLNRYKFSYEVNDIVSVLNVQTHETADFLLCELKEGAVFYPGEKLKILITDLEDLKTFQINHYNFGTQSSGTIQVLNNEYLKSYYTFDFDQYFESTPYFFDTYDVKNSDVFNLFRIGARSLDELTNTFVHYCFYDKE